MTKETIDIDQLTPGEIRTILDRYETLVEVMTEANNTLAAKLASHPDTTPDQVKVINDWATFMVGLHQLHALEIERAAASLQ